MRLNLLHKFVIVVGTLGWAATALMAEPEVFIDEAAKAALGGYDAVSYFDPNGPKPGKPENSTEWKSAVWQFSSTENLALFKSDPGKYAPQYGGYCAYAAAHGSTAPGDPLAWTLHKGKLYINLSSSIRDEWKQDLEENISKADANWPDILE